MKKTVIAIVVLALLVSFVHAATEEEIRDALAQALVEFLEDPTTSVLSAEETEQLLDHYVLVLENPATPTPTDIENLIVRVETPIEQRPLTSRPPPTAPVDLPSAPPTTAPTTPAGIVYGDVNLDGEVSAGDLNMMVDWLLGREAGPSPGSAVFEPGDVDGSGTIDMIDMNYMVDYILQRISSFPVEDGGAISNVKDMSKFSNKEVFLISNNNWKDVLPLVPLTTWTQQSTNEGACQRGDGTPNNVCVYPTLIYHEESAGFDADSIIYFMQQYSPEKVTVIGQTPQELDNLLIAPLDLGAGLSSGDIQRISINDYFSHWDTYGDAVYVEDDYELALLASTYASLINAPLVIEGTSYGDALDGKNVICVGNPSGANCNDQYDLESLQQKYADETGTDKIMLVNPNDLDIYHDPTWINERSGETGGFTLEKSTGEIFKLYTKNSLTAPILASARQEVILSTASTNYLDVDTFIENKINSLAISPEYLTIIASPNAIKMSKETAVDYQGRKWREEVDNHLYGNLDSDSFQELAVGRIFSLTTSDVSSYLARDLFYSQLPKDNEFSIIWPGMPGNFPNMKVQGLAIEDIFENMGLNSVSFMTNAQIPPTASEFKNKFMLTYFDHAWTDGGGYNFNTPALKSEQVWLNSPLVFMEGCGSCAFELAFNKQNLFCANLLRRGAIFHYGATIDASATDWDPGKMIVEELLVSENIGQAVKNIRNKASMWGIYINSGFSGLLEGDPRLRAEYDKWDILIGDPLFNPNLQKPQLEELTVSFNEIDNLNYVIDIFVPEINKDIEVDYNSLGFLVEVDAFNYPFGNNIGRIYRAALREYDETTGDLVIERRIEQGHLSFSLNVPTGYSIKQINEVEYIDANSTRSINSMPVFEEGEGEGSFITYAKDEGSENIYYFIMLIAYGGNPSVVITEQTIQEHRFKIYLELEEVAG